MNRRRGMTVMEIMILIVVLGVVGAITLPKFRTKLYQSREARTKTHLGDLRGALAIYYSDNSGLYPSDDGTPETRLASALVPQYIKAIPATDLTHLHKAQRTVEDRFDDGGDWTYSMLNGFIAVNCWHRDTKGVAISNW